MAEPTTEARGIRSEAGAGGWPLGLSVGTVAAMLNFEIIDHPVYSGLEVQLFDDDVHGSGVLVMLVRRGDGMVDVYHQPGLTVDRGAYGVGGGLGEWIETVIEPATLEVTPFGVHVDLRLHDSVGRTIEVRVDDRGGRPRRHGALLAPAGASAEQPGSLLLVWMRRFDLVRRTRSSRPLIRICDEPVRTGRLPGSWLHRRHLIKYAAGLVVAEVNPEGQVSSTGFDGTRLEAPAAGDESVRAWLEFTPPLPPPHTVGSDTASHGRWTVGIADQPAVVGGTWTVSRDGGVAALTMNVTRPWRPRKLPPLMRLVTTVVPVFRKWPTTYRWRAEIPDGNVAGATARWERIGTGWDSSYRRISR